MTSRLPANFDARTMVRDARQGHHASAGLLLAAGQVLAVAACPVALTGRSEWPVLVSTKILDVGLMSGMAERAGGAVAISDGRRLLVAATTGAAGGADDLAGAQAGASICRRPARARSGRRPWPRCRCPGGLRVLVGVAAPASAPGRHAAAVVGAGDPDHRRDVFDRPLRDAGAARVRRRRSRRWCPRPGADAALASIGRYTIVERIGQGGMAEIYAAVTQGEGSFRRPVVIKRLRPELTIDPNAVAQFCDEANLLAALHHPNIVAVHDFGRSQGQYFLAEEYVVGRDLGRARRAPLRAGAPAAARRGHRLRRRASCSRRWSTRTA